ncbi:LacI family DNA-binding transcriptional regulator [Heyndrickxia coagulans]|uniref:LacI family DNA-binding transcriptional regulator n=1 Tax=Heyndrickxia coagulans TaxID=1398 RepID=UPI000CE29C20|nr:LacI family DNA-binding transcriptional regulator [Heyndrickxia coagulans]AVD54972.1 LacI family transcriptional regulator [Heyndrickxia coagulans]
MRGKEAKVTIYDVAKKAGVSKSTVSRYLGGRFHELSPKTQQKIKQVIDELQYRPNNLARGLKSSRSYLIGALVADITNPYTTAILRGAEDVCKQHGYSLLICNSDNRPAKEREYISMLQSHKIDGLLIQTTGGNSDFLETLSENGKTPIVLVDRKIPALPFDTVEIDNRGAVMQAVSYLIKKNYKRIGYFTEPVAHFSPRHERYTGFQEALRLVSPSHPSLEDLFEVDLKDESQLEKKLNTFLSRTSKEPRAIIAGNSVIALKIIIKLKEQGYKIPDDTGFLSFDNPEWAAAVFSGITTIEQPTYQIGKTVMELILKRLADNESPVQTISYQTRLIERESTPGR